MKRLLFSLLLLLLVPNMTSAAESSRFSDTSDHWAEMQIEAAAQKGYVSGYPDGSFKPDHIVTRAEFVRMLVDALKLPHSQGREPWYQPYVAVLIEVGILMEKEFGSDYDLPLTRREMARLAVRAADVNLAAENAMSDAELLNEAVKKGLIHGMGKGMLALDSYSTRAQAVAVIERVLLVMSGHELEVNEELLKEE